MVARTVANCLRDVVVQHSTSGGLRPKDVEVERSARHEEDCAPGGEQHLQANLRRPVEHRLEPATCRSWSRRGSEDRI